MLGRLCLGIFVTTSVASAVAADDRESQLSKMVAMHREMAEAEQEAAARIGYVHLGAGLNEIGAKEYACATLAFLFEKELIFRRLGTIERGPASESDGGTAAEAHSIKALQHENWVIAAENTLRMSERERIEAWNLNCVRQHGIGKEHYLASLSPDAEFKIVGDQVHVLGDIDAGFFKRFEKALSGNPQVKTVALGSGGGHIMDAILAGALIRRRSLDTTLHADCYSACTLIFMGGVNRTVSSPYPRLGFHQVSRDGHAVAKTDGVYSLVGNYINAMGGRSDIVIEFMHRAPPNDMFYPDVSDLCEPSIATWVQRLC
jgi:hypothetical protein